MFWLNGVSINKRTNDIKRRVYQVSSMLFGVPFYSTEKIIFPFLIAEFVISQGKR